MAVTTARGVMVASEREGADGLLLPPLARAELEPIARRGAASCSQPLLLACAGGRPLPQEAAGRRHEQPRIRPRPERRAALRGCAGPPREQHRPHAASCEQATGSSSCSAAPRSQACAPTSEERGPACAARQRHAVSRLFGSLPFPRPGARRARGVRPTADAATPGPRVHCSLFHNWPRSRHCARARARAARLLSPSSLRIDRGNPQRERVARKHSSSRLRQVADYQTK